MTIQKVIFDTDPGIDDALALLYLHACPDLELLGITTTLGNASIEDCTTNALFLCEAYDIDVPVYRGDAAAVNGSIPSHYPDFVHGANGLGGFDVSVNHKTVETASAASYIISETRRSPEPVRIIAVGRLTNIALALNGDPGIASRIHDIVFMGGTIEHEGNVSPWAEANIFGDPEAAEIVFRSGIPMTMVGLDVTMQTRFTLSYLDEACSSAPPLLKDLIHSTNAAYLEYHKTSLGWEDSPVHDSSAIAFADRPALFETRSGSLTCKLEGEQRGRTCFEENEAGPHKVCFGVNSDALRERFSENVSRLFEKPHDSP